jgi:hypothetical protein
MSNQLVWTELRDRALRTLREQGKSWDLIATALGMSRWAAIERARAIGAHIPLPPRPPRPEKGPGGREPLPAGHPLAWQVLTEGTLLAGEAYPYPPLPPVEEEEEPAALRLAA